MTARRPALVVLTALGAVSVSGAAPGCAPRTPTAMERAREAVRTAPRSSGDLRLRCEPRDAAVAVDGVPRGSCADFEGAQAALRVGEGLHRIEVTKRGFQPYVTYYEPGGVRAALTVRLSPVAPGEGEVR